MRRVVVGLLAVVVLAAGAGCSGDDEAPSGAGPSVLEATPGATLEVGERLWDSREVDLRGLTGYVRRGSSTIVSGYDRYAQDDFHVVSVDARTGEERWRSTVLQPVGDAGTLWSDGFATGPDAGDPVAVVVRPPADGSPDPGRAVVALDPRSGREVWRWNGGVPGSDDSVAPRSPLSDDAEIDLVPATADVVLASVGGPGLQDTASSLAALDLETGRVLWVRRQTQSVAVVGGVVLTSDGARLTALGLRDGEPRWRRPAPGVTVAGVAEGRVLLTVTGSDPTSLVVDAESGDEVLELTTDARAASVTDDAGSQRVPSALVAWTDRDGRLWSLAAGETDPSVSPRTVGGAVLGVVGEWIATTEGVVDRAGEPVDLGADEVLFAVDDQTVLTGTYQRDFAVHERR